MNIARPIALCFDKGARAGSHRIPAIAACKMCVERGGKAIAARGRLQLLRRCRRVVDTDRFAARLAAERVAPVELHGAVRELAGLQRAASIEAAVQGHEGTAVQRFDGGRSR